MRPRVAVFCLAALLASAPARADAPRTWFDAAVEIELHGGANAAQSAFALYQRAAEAGLPEAEFNTAVMLDSGRGIERNVELAATWYARAASHGHERAAYNLGQLYQAGDGVPVNTDLARAWFGASNLPAARGKASVPADTPAKDSPALTPVPVAPHQGVRQISDAGGIELVWTSVQQPEPALFFVEIRAMESTGTHEVFSGITQLSSLFVVLPQPRGDFAWRVTAITRKGGHYAPSAWVRFSLASMARFSSQ